MSFHFSKQSMATVTIWMLGVLLPAIAHAQLGPLSMFSNPSARGLAMGQTGGADASDPTNSYLNPALLADRSGLHLSGFYGQLLSDLSSHVRFKAFAMGGGYVLGDRSDVAIMFGGQLRYGHVSYGESFIASSLGPGGTVNPSDSYVAVSLAGGLRFSDFVSVALGVTFKDWKTDPDFSGSEALDGTASDLGLRVALETASENGWKTTVALAASVFNLNGEYRAGGAEYDFDHDADYAFSIRADGPLRQLGTGRYVPKVEFCF